MAEPGQLTHVQHPEVLKFTQLSINHIDQAVICHTVYYMLETEKKKKGSLSIPSKGAQFSGMGE